MNGTGNMNDMDNMNDMENMSDMNNANNTDRVDRKRIAVIFGGRSPEYDVSLESVCAVIRSMDRRLFEPILIGITRDGEWYRFEGDAEEIENDTWRDSGSCVPVMISPGRSGHGLALYRDGVVESMRIDAAFPVLHGKNGEDGTVQGLLELAGIPVAGCGVLSSALCMDKYRAHRLVCDAGVDVPRSYMIDGSASATRGKELFSMGGDIGYPLFVKPLRAGSSFGITKVAGEEELAAAVEAALMYDDKAVLEEAIDGFEVGCAVMGEDELIVGEVDEIELSDGFFDYAEKYTLKTSAIHVPARIDESTAERVKETARLIYRILDCGGLARVDMFLSRDGRIVFNEANTIPGLTAHSRFPNMLKAIGMPFEQIISAVIGQVLEKAEKAKEYL